MRDRNEVPPKGRARDLTAFPSKNWWKLSNILHGPLDVSVVLPPNTKFEDIERNWVRFFTAAIFDVSVVDPPNTKLVEIEQHWRILHGPVSSSRG